VGCVGFDRSSVVRAQHSAILARSDVADLHWVDSNCLLVHHASPDLLFRGSHAFSEQHFGCGRSICLLTADCGQGVDVDFHQQGLRHPSLVFLVTVFFFFVCKKVAARIVNIMSNDLQRVFMMVMFTPICVGGVLGVLGVAVALVVQFDAAGAPPAAILMLSFPLNQLLSRRGSALAQVVLPLADARVKLMTHIVKAITVVKLFAWENLLAGRIEQVRANELKQRLKASTVTALLEAVALSTIAIATALFLLTWTLLGRPFLASDIFTAIALIVVGRIPLIQVSLQASFIVLGPTFCFRCNCLLSILAKALARQDEWQRF
jgi:hypothetical protein